jgi:hypothetical protein
VISQCLGHGFLHINLNSERAGCAIAANSATTAMHSRSSAARIGQGRGLVADKVKWLRQRFKAMDAVRPCRPLARVIFQNQALMRAKVIKVIAKQVMNPKRRTISGLALP